MLFEYLLLILAFLLASWNSGEGLLSSGILAAVTSAVGAVLGSLVLTRMTARALARRMKKWKGDWGPLVNEYARTMALVRAAILALFAGAVHAGGWGEFVRQGLGLAHVPLAREAVILVPFLAAWLGGSWFLFHLEGGEERPREYLAFRARSAAGFLGLLVLGGGVLEIVFTGSATRTLFEARPWLEAATAGVLLAVGALGVPLALRVVWSTRPLPTGELHSALAEFGKEAGFRYGGVRIWETGGLTILNAAVAGLVPALRTVFLTRGMLENLKLREILSVFAHEAGHVKGRHALISMSLGLGWAGFVLSVDGGALALPEGPAVLAVQGAITAVFAVLYLALSRTLEKEADLFASDALGDPGLVANTLLRVAMLNGDTRSLSSWTHASAGVRADFLKRAATDPAERSRFRSSLRRWAGLCMFTLVAGLSAALPRFL